MENNSTLFIVGATGYIGGTLLSNAKRAGSAIGTSSLGGNDHLPLRLDAPSEFDCDKIHPGDVVMLTAAISAPDICAREHDRARTVNVTGTSGFIQSVIDCGEHFFDQVKNALRENGSFVISDMIGRNVTRDGPR